VSGLCPRCRHPISKGLRAQEGVIAAAGPDPPKDLIYLMTCNCVHGHAGAPEGAYGCGAQGGLTVVGTDGAFEVQYRHVSPEQREVEAWADDALRNRLKRTRAWAQQWMTLLTAVTGLVSFGAILDVAGDLGALAWGWRLLYATLGGLALACMVAAIVRAWQASNPVSIGRLEADCVSRRSMYDAAVARSATSLADSYGWTVVGASLFVISMIVRVMTAPPPS
jgi:hypothetical protein